jgi:hypothetical protein
LKLLGNMGEILWNCWETWRNTSEDVGIMVKMWKKTYGKNGEQPLKLVGKVVNIWTYDVNIFSCGKNGTSATRSFWFSIKWRTINEGVGQHKSFVFRKVGGK